LWYMAFGVILILSAWWRTYTFRDGSVQPQGNSDDS
jgi:hypothetical protein